ncbi:MAG: CopD family protein [Actinomycetota bacterium]|nr:CopD family protein [Actinomycetota bacterium]
MAVVQGVVFASHSLLFGLPLIMLLVGRPTFGSQDASIAESRFRVSRRLRNVLYAALVLGLAATAVAVYNQILVLAEAGGVEPSRAEMDAMFASSFGQWHLLRVPLSVAIAMALWGRVRLWGLAGVGDAAPRPPLRWWMGWALLALALLATISMSGHATGQDQPWYSVTNDVVHLAAGATWMSGIILLTFVLPSAWRGANPEQKLSLLAPAVNRFAPVALVSILIVAATGVLNSFLRLEAPGDLVHSDYGRVLGLKLCGFVCIVALGTINHFVLRARLLAARRRRQPTRAQNVLRRSVALEAALAVVILGLTSVLVALPPTRGA